MCYLLGVQSLALILSLPCCKWYICLPLPIIMDPDYHYSSLSGDVRSQGVSLAFRKLSKIISWKNTMPEILIRSMIFAVYKFWENILESSWNVSETPPGQHQAWHQPSLSRNNWNNYALWPNSQDIEITNYLIQQACRSNYTDPGYGLSLVDT